MLAKHELPHALDDADNRIPSASPPPQYDATRQELRGNNRDPESRLCAHEHFKPGVTAERA